MAQEQYDNDTQTEREQKGNKEREEDEVEKERMEKQEITKQQIYHILRVQQMFIQRVVAILDTISLDARAYYSYYYNK